MKPIKSSELKIGDVVSTEEIFDWVGVDGLLHSRRTIIEVKKVVLKDKDGKPSIFVECWEFVEGGMNKVGLPSKIGELYLIEGKELTDFKKILILNKLENG